MKSAAIGVALAVSLLPRTAHAERLDHASSVAHSPEEAALKSGGVRSTLPFPWTDGILFNGNVGALKPERASMRLAGDLALGFNGARWGVIGRGSAKAHRFEASEWVGSTTSNYDVALEGWRLIGLGAWRLELRAVFGGSRYQSTIDNRVRSTYQHLDEASWMLRSLVMPGVRYQPSRRFAAGVWIGVGGQIEKYERSDIKARSDQAAINAREPSLLLHLRSSLQVQVVPRVMVTRLRVDASRYQIRRESLTFLVSPSAVTREQDINDSTQAEVTTRLFLDVEALRFWDGFVPGVFGGLDYVRRTSSHEPTYSALVPSFGAGLRMEMF